MIKNKLSDYRQKWFVAIAGWADATNSNLPSIHIKSDIDKLRSNITQEPDMDAEAMLWGRIVTAWEQVQAAYNMLIKAWVQLDDMKNEAGFDEIFDEAWSVLEQAKVEGVELAENDDESAWVLIKRLRLFYLKGQDDEV